MKKNSALKYLVLAFLCVGSTALADAAQTRATFLKFGCPDFGSRFALVQAFANLKIQILTEKYTGTPEQDESVAQFMEKNDTLIPVTKLDSALYADSVSDEDINGLLTKYGFPDYETRFQKVAALFEEDTDLFPGIDGQTEYSGTAEEDRKLAAYLSANK